MNIRTKLMLLSILFSMGALSFTVLGIASLQRSNDINDSIKKGIELQVRSRDVHSLMKDMVFDIFVPKVYGQLKSYTYSPRTTVTLRKWRVAVDVYEQAFDEFMRTQSLLDIQEDELLDQFATATTMHDRAMDRLEELNRSIEELNRDFSTIDEERFDKIFSDDTYTPFFEEFRDTTYYFVDSFESFMNYFIDQFTQYGIKLERQVYLMYGFLALCLTVSGVLISMLFSKDILEKISRVRAAFARISKGDFSVRLEIAGHDEFSELAEHFNSLAQDLKHNVNTILLLTQSVGDSQQEVFNLDDLFHSVVSSVIQETQVDTAFIHMIGTDPKRPGGTQIKLQSQEGRSADVDLQAIQKSIEQVVQTGKQKICYAPQLEERLQGLSSLIIMPLVLRKEVVGTLTVAIHAPDPAFTDLGVTRLSTFAEFASLIVDNHMKFAELITKGEAEYQALQAQMQPHFIYNILNGFIGLNRMGMKQGLEQSIIHLKDMLRYTQDARRVTTIGEEIAFVENYCLLQKLRFSERLDYRLKVEAGLETVSIPRLLLQPLVENAVIHGIEDLQDRVGVLYVEVFGTLEDGVSMVTIVVTDNGVGFDLSTLQEKEHIGIGNVRRRFKYAFPHSSFTVKSSHNNGTEIRMAFHEMHNS
ncbi:MAG: histidine kinase [Spirochaetia bacterium]|nr:histidine kinase [Spirochaetia bacterium]